MGRRGIGVVVALLVMAWSAPGLGQEAGDAPPRPSEPARGDEAASHDEATSGDATDDEAASHDEATSDARPTGPDAAAEGQQELAAPPPGSTEPSYARPVPQPTDVARAEPPRADDPVWGLYQDATLALAEGERDRAAELLRRVCRQAPEHPAAIEARRLLDRMGQRVETRARSGERRSNLARAELAARQTMQGGAAGVLVCYLLDCSDARPWTASILLGASTGLGLSLGLTRGGVSPGQAVLYTTVPRWGYLNGFLLFTALGVNFREDDFGSLDWRPRTTAVTLLLSHALSLGAAAAVDHFLAPTAGDVAIMDTFMTAASAMLMSIYVIAGAFDHVGNGGFRGLMGGFVAANALALTGAGLLTRSVEFSRTRSLLIDLGMAGGFGVGFGLVVLVQGDDFDPRAGFGAAAAGLAAGFGLSYWLTRNVGGDDDVPAVEVSLAPTLGGATAAVRATF